MSLPRDVVDALDMASDTLSSYLNRKTGEIVSLTEDIMMMAEDDDDLDGISEWEREEVLKAREVRDSDDYIGLPGGYEIDEYRIMEDFIDQLPPGKAQEELAYAIRGKGAFRRFKQSVRYHGLEQRWYDYLAEAYRVLAIRWCAEEGLEYTE